MSQIFSQVRVFGLKKLFLKRFYDRSTTRTRITNKNDHSALTAIFLTPRPPEMTLLAMIRVKDFFAARIYRFYKCSNRMETLILRKTCFEPF